MAAPIKAITSAFNQVVRRTAFFRGWRKHGGRRFWNEAEPIHLGIELTLFEHSWENNQVVGVAVLFAFPTAIEPLSQGYGGTSADGRFIVTTYASPTEGMGLPNFGSDRAIHIREPQDIEQFKSELPHLFSAVVIPFLEHHHGERSVFEWYNQHNRMPASLPLTFALNGAAAARRSFAQWLLECNEERGGERLVRWLERYELLPQPTLQRFRLADMQAREEYCREIREIALGLLRGGA